MPKESAAIEIRPPSKIVIACLKPSPSLPNKFSFGTRTLSKISSVVSEARIPNLFSFFP